MVTLDTANLFSSNLLRRHIIRVTLRCRLTSIRRKLYHWHNRKTCNMLPKILALSRNIVINNSFAPGTDLRTIDQAATQIGLRVQRALRRST